MRTTVRTTPTRGAPPAQLLFGPGRAPSGTDGVAG